MKFTLLGTPDAITQDTNKHTGKAFIRLLVSEPHGYKTGERSTFEIMAFGAATAQCAGLSAGMPVFVMGSADGTQSSGGYFNAKLRLDRIANLWAKGDAIAGRPPEAPTGGQAPAEATGAPTPHSKQAPAAAQAAQQESETGDDTPF